MKLCHMTDGKWWFTKIQQFVCFCGKITLKWFFLNRQANLTQSHLNGSDDFLAVVDGRRCYQGYKQVLKVAMGVALQVSH